MRILALISDRPDPPITGSRVRNYNLWKELRAQGIEVKVLGLGEAGVFGEEEYFGFDRPTAVKRAFNSVLHSYHEWPRSQALAAGIKDVIREWKPDIIHAEELKMGGYLTNLSGPFKRTITLHNVESVLIQKTGSSPFKIGASLINRLHRISLSRFEHQIFDGVDLAFAYSQLDQKKYQRLYPGVRWRSTRNGVDARAIHPTSQVKDPRILFVGSLSYMPNVRGLFWFLDHVLPRMSSKVRLTVAGSRATMEVRRKLSGSDVTFLDTPKDLAPIYSDHALAVVPLFEGSGTRGKILEALAFERAVVTTATGVEGLELKPGQGYVQAESPSFFATEIERLLGDMNVRTEIAREGRKAVEAIYDWSGVARDLHNEWTRLLSPLGSGRTP